MSTYDEHKPQHYDIKMTSSIAALGCDLSYSLSPPSYSQVMAEKFECASKNKDTKADYTVTAWDNRLSEVKVAVENARQFINSTNEMMDKLRYHSIRLECKNEYFEEDLQRFFQNEEPNFSSGSTLYNIKNQSKSDQQNNAAEGLSRMNFLVQDLITEAQESLTKRVPRHIHSKENNIDLRHKESSVSKKFNDPSSPEKKDALYWKKYHKARYFRSQWKLIQTMRQLIDTVQTTVISQDEQQQQQQTKTQRYPSSSSTTTITEAIPVQHHHIHHHYHHIYHHHPPPPTSSSILDTLKTQASHNTAAAASFLKQALQTVGMMHPTNTITINSPVKSRSVLYATLLLIYTLDYNMLLFRNRDYATLARANKITMAWTQNSRYKQLYEKWNRKAYLIMYLVRYIMLS